MSYCITKELWKLLADCQSSVLLPLSLSLSVDEKEQNKWKAGKLCLELWQLHSRVGFNLTIGIYSFITCLSFLFSGELMVGSPPPRLIFTVTPEMPQD